MKLLFAHDHRLYKLGDEFFTTGGLSDDITKRYTDVFDEMVLLCRTNITNSTEDILQLTKITNGSLYIECIAKNLIYPTKENVDLINNLINETDCVICRLPSFLGMYTALISLLNKRSLYIEIVGSSFGSYWHKSLLGKMIAFPSELISKYLVRKASYILYVSEDYLQKEYPSKKRTLSCSDVVLGDRDVSVLNNRIKKIKDLKNIKKIKIGTLAQVDQKYKGQKTVIRVIAMLKKYGWDIEYMLAGSGSAEYLHRVAVKYGVEDNVTFLGLLTHDKVNSFIDGIDIYVQPSLTEGMPRSVIEALYRGCPVIVSDAGGMYELVEEDYIFKKGNCESLAGLLNNIDKKKMLDMAKRNYNFSHKFRYDYLAKRRRDFMEEYRNEVLNQDGMV